MQGELTTVVLQVLLPEAGDQVQHFAFGVRLLQGQAVFV